MLCAPRQVIVVFIGAVFFVDFYTKDGSEEWTRVLKDALGDIGLSLAAPSLRGFFSPRLIFRGISWPWSLSWRPQVILIAGIFFLGIEYTQAAWRVAYYKLLHGKWGSWIKPLSEGVKRRAALVIERSLLTFAPLLFEYGRNGTGATDEDLKAWARNNPNATKIDLDGLTSLTGDGIAEVIKMLPRLTTFDMNSEEVDLSSKGITGELAKFIAAKLPGSPVTTLNLSGNYYIGDEGLKAIVAATTLPGSSVTTLDLSSNKIGDEGCKAVADKLPGSSVTTLNLELNAIGDEGCKAITDKLPDSSVTTLRLGGNAIDDKTMKATIAAQMKAVAGEIEELKARLEELKATPVNLPDQVAFIDGHEAAWYA